MILLPLFLYEGALFACGWRDSNPRLLPCQGNTLNQLSYTHARGTTNIIYAKEEEKRASEQNAFVFSFHEAVLAAFFRAIFLGVSLRPSFGEVLGLLGLFDAKSLAHRPP